MKKRWYRIKGVTGKMLANWEGNVRDDLKCITLSDGEELILIQLTWFESVIMKYKIIRDFMKERSEFSLRKI